VNYVTGEQVRDAMAAADITRVDHHDCGICGEMVFYSREGSRLFFNSGCGCGSSPARGVEWQSAADFINNQNEHWRNELYARFGLLSMLPYARVLKDD